MGPFNKMSATNWKPRHSNMYFFSTGLVSILHWLLLLTFSGWQGGDNWPTPPRARAPRLKRYWADTKVTMCSRQVWAVHGDRNWEMCPLVTGLTILKEARDLQQVLSSQDPLTPWHLHSTFIVRSKSWKSSNVCVNYGISNVLSSLKFADNWVKTSFSCVFDVLM